MNIVRFLRHRLKTLRGMTVVHIGAHHGQEGKRYESMFARKVIWIEANPKTFGMLQDRIRHLESQPRSLLGRLLGIAPTEHVCINALVTDRDGAEHEFYEFNNDGASDSIFHLAPDTRFSELEETGVNLRLQSSTLDTILRNVGQDPADVDVLVIDTQGAELMCLKGSEGTLKYVRYVEAEVSTQPVYEGGVLYDELGGWLNARGFRRKTAIRRSHMNVIFQSDDIQRAA